MISKAILENLVSIKSMKIDDSRKQLLEPLTSYLSDKLKVGETPKLNFICTHNSRRSQLAQIMAKVAATYHGIEIESYSGGTEATAFNKNAIDAVKQFGFHMEQSAETNPLVLVYYNHKNPIKCFSKVYDDKTNPTEDFAAVMTCSDADENCPVVFGAEKRLKLTYRDPKASDGTGNESKVYYERLCQIAAEMLYTFGNVRL